MAAPTFNTPLHPEAFRPPLPTNKEKAKVNSTVGKISGKVALTVLENMTIENAMQLLDPKEQALGNQWGQHPYSTEKLMAEIKNGLHKQ